MKGERVPGSGSRKAGRALAAALVAFGALVAIPAVVLGDAKPTLNGTWSASALGESWSFSSWGDACGPKPAPKGAGGGTVQIREQGGELSIIGAGRAFSTAECWEQMPGLARSTHSASSRGWRTRCSTPANDPRRATVITTISASDSSISLHETGQYEFIIDDTTCSASVVRSRSFTLVKREGEEPPAASATATASAAPSAPPAATTAAPAAKPDKPEKPAPEPRASRCAGAAGEPARLEVHPGRKLLRAGDRFTFRAVVLDAEGCPTGTRPAWSVLPGPLAAKASVDASGTVKVADDAGEGKLEVSAQVAGKGVTVPIEVASAEHYDALLAASGLNDAGEGGEAAVAVIATSAIGGRTGVAQDGARERKMLFVTIVGALALTLGFVGLVFARRGRRREADEEVEGDAPASSGAPPSNGEGGPARAPETPAPAAQKPAARVRGKICPTCGERYDGEATFCGKDATKLVLLN